MRRKTKIRVPRAEEIEETAPEPPEETTYEDEGERKAITLVPRPRKS